MNKKTLTGLIAATALTGTFSAITPAFAGDLSTTASANTTSAFVVTVEAPGVQDSQLLTNTNYKAKNVFVERFDSPNQTAGVNNNNMVFAGDSKIGTYDQAFINKADVYGGAGGKGNYYDVDTKISNTTESTLNLASPQRYFGLWWSAGDSSNILEFYSKGTLVERFNTKDVVDFIAKQSNKSDYYGNPNDNFKGQDSTEPFAFLNFFADPNDTNVTFDQIKFTNIGGSGFESDNHTIASAYGNITGTSIVAKTPESSSVLGMIAIGFVGVSSTIARKNKKSGAVVG